MPRRTTWSGKTRRSWTHKFKLKICDRRDIEDRKRDRDKTHILVMCVCVCFLPIHSRHQVRWTYQPGSHRRKVTQDFSSTFLLRFCCCVCVFFPSILGIKFVGRTSRGHTGGRSHRISHPPSFCGFAVACFLPIHSGHQVRWTYQPGSHRRKVTHNFSSTFFLRCVP